MMIFTKKVVSNEHPDKDVHLWWKRGNFNISLWDDDYRLCPRPVTPGEATIIQMTFIKEDVAYVLSLGGLFEIAISPVAGNALRAAESSYLSLASVGKANELADIEYIPSPTRTSRR